MRLLAGLGALLAVLVASVGCSFVARTAILVVAGVLVIFFVFILGACRALGPHPPQWRQRDEGA